MLFKIGKMPVILQEWNFLKSKRQQKYHKYKGGGVRKACNTIYLVKTFSPYIHTHTSFSQFFIKIRRERERLLAVKLRINLPHLSVVETSLNIRQNIEYPVINGHVV